MTQEIPITGTLASHVIEIASDSASGQIRLSQHGQPWIMDSRDVDFNFLKFFFLKVGTCRSFYMSQGQGPVQAELNKISLGQGSQEGPVSWQAKAAPALHYESRNWHSSHICILQILRARYWITKEGIFTSSRKGLHPKQPACQSPKKNAGQQSQHITHYSGCWLWGPWNSSPELCISVLWTTESLHYPV